MNRLYVHALTDRPVRTWTEHGRTFESVHIGSIYAVCERRPDAPALSEEELRRQHAIVVRIAERTPAVLPARFGAIVGHEELADIVARRAAAIDEALAAVRGNVQMTVRVALRGKPRSTAAPVSGTDYLEQRRRQASPPLPPRAQAALERVSAHVIRELRESTPAGSAVVYHLVRRDSAGAYRAALEGVAGLTVSGPWPPFAFGPELWS